ncbi:MAG: hypothetical protein ACHQIH_02810 [Ignavibacteria bacterium]
MIKYYNSGRIVRIVFFCITFLVISAGAVFQQNLQDRNENKSNSVPQKLKPDNVNSSEEESGPADTVKIGAYIFSVYDLDFPGNKINADFYVWYNTTKDSLELLKYFELVNAVNFERSGETDERRGNIIYQTLRINSKLKTSWDVSHFPFDRQSVEIMIEDYDKDNSKLIFVPDTIGSKIDKSVRIEGWKVKDFGIKVVDHTYETNYGDPSIPLNEYSAYSRVVIYFTIEREGKGLFFKLFIGLFISVLISLLTFFVNPLDLDPRFGLSVGAIFAAIASQYVISSTLPQNAKLTLVDILHDISFIFIFVCILVSTISLHLKKNGKEEQSQKLDRYSFFVLAASYIILAAYFIVSSF